MVQMPTKHVFFHFNTMALHMAVVLQRIMINYGALLRLMLMEITLKENGETVTAIVINSIVLEAVSSHHLGFLESMTTTFT